MTAPRAVASIAASVVPVHEPKADRAVVVERAQVPDEPSPPVVPIALSEIEQLAETLRDAGNGAHKITVIGTAPGESITLTTLTLARLLARSARVVVIDLAGSSPTAAAVSVDPNTPGLAELMQGTASFAEVITRDKLSRLNLVNAGRPGFDRALLQSPRLTLAIDAMLRVYEHVLLDAGTASDLPAELLTANARAVVVPDASMAQDARKVMCDQLRVVGFSEVDMLSEPARLSNVSEQAPQVVAA
jgi:Mrp family chromosome partitioning ATPase